MSVKRILSYPMKATYLYLLFTVALFLLGPIKWDVPSYTKITIVLLVYVLAFVLGYYCQMRKKVRRFSYYNDGKTNVDADELEFMSQYPTRSLNLVFVISCVYAIIVLSVNMIHYYDGINFSALFNTNLAESYYDNVNSNIEGRWYLYALNLLYVLNVFWFPIGVLRFRRMTFRYRILFVFTILLSVIYNLQHGGMMAWGLYIIQLIPFLILNLSKSRNKKKSGTRKKSRRKTILTALILMTFLLFFDYSQNLRYKFRGHDEVTYMTGGMKNFIEEQVEVPVFNSLIRSTDFYLTNGYCGMAYALELPPQFSYGIGFSRDFARVLFSYTGFDVTDATYPERLEKAYGWDNGLYWPSAYTWFASDWTFWGIPILMFLFGRLVCSAWYSALFEKSVIGFALSCWLWIGIIFLPCNNQLFQSFEKFMATVTILLLFALRKYLPKITILKRGE